MTDLGAHQSRKVVSRPFFASLDGFRGLLALFVAVHHSQWFSYLNYKSFVNEGYVLIDLFFVFSGFLLYTLYGNKLKTGADVSDFIKRRISRLYPIHIFMLLVFLAFNLLRLWLHNGEGSVPFGANAPDNWATFLSNIVLTHSMGIHESLSFNWPSWTISVEFYVYFIFASMILFLKPNKGWHMALMAACIALIYYGLSRIGSDMNITYDYGFWRCLGGFYTGLLVAYVYARILTRRMHKPAPSVWVANCFEVAALLTYALFITYFTGKLQFFVAPVAFFFVLIFAQDLGWISKAISTRPFRYLAKISYSVYMVHFVIAFSTDIFAKKVLSRILGENFHDSHITGDLYLVFYLGVVIVAAHLLQKYVENPAAKWLGKRRPTRTRLKQWVHA